MVLMNVISPPVYAHRWRDNLIMNNGSGTGHRFPCPKAVISSDPQLQPLQWNSPGNTPTMAIPDGSSAIDEGRSRPEQVAVDRPTRRGSPAPRGGRFDIGAFEARSEDQTTTWNPSDKSTSVTLANGDLTFVTAGRLQWRSCGGLGIVRQKILGTYGETNK